MRKIMLMATALAFGLGAAAPSASAADEVTLQLKWVTQAQFAGYYVAQDKGFYAEIGFDMAVKGSFHEIATFIDSISQLQRIVNVTDLTMSTPVQQNSKIVVNSTFKVKTYRFTKKGQ